MFCNTARPLLIIFLVLATGCVEQQKNTQAPPTPTVLFVQPNTEVVTEFEEFTGRTVASEVVELRARVGGYLRDVNFTEGSMVEKDQVLFQIDDRPFLADQERATATVARIDARIRRLESQLRRAQELMQKKALSENEFDTARFDLDEARAELLEAKAALQIAELNLEFTRIKAPLDGRIGRRMVDPGNIVLADQTSLATIVPTDVIHVDFDIDERTVLRLRRLESAGALVSAQSEPVPVSISLADTDHFDVEGTVDFLDNRIDAATGTLRARATVQNRDGLLSAGLFVRLRFPIGKPGPALMIPEEALASDQGRPFVYVVKDHEGKTIADARNVELGPLFGGKRVIRSGLTGDEKVIVTGLQRLRRKMEIQPKPQPVTEPDAASDLGLPAGPAPRATAARE
ncbi:MAG: efflux RND transporter periplasmic adaptor subunit [Planctomycetota bacterium]